MRSLARRPRRRAGERGFTLIELVVALGLVTVGIVALVAGLQVATGTAESGRQQTTAVFLAEQRLEQVKAAALRDFSTVVPGAFPQEAYGTIAGSPGYRREVAILVAPEGLPNAALVQVLVRYRPVTERGVLLQEREVSLSTFMARRGI